MTRAALRILAALTIPHVLGVAAALLIRSGPLQERAAQLDARALVELTARFEPALAPGLLASVGPQGAAYQVLACAALLAALIARWRSVPLIALSLGLCLVLGNELAWVLGRAVDRAGPIVAQPSLPIPPEWRLEWQAGSAFPNRHALLTAALGATLARAWLPLVVVGYPVALVSAATPVFFGAAWASDALAGLVLGILVAEAARVVARELLPIAPRLLRRRSTGVRNTPVLHPPLPVAAPATRVVASP